MRFQDRDLGPGLRVPNPRRAVGRRSHRVLAAGAESRDARSSRFSYGGAWRIRSNTQRDRSLCEIKILTIRRRSLSAVRIAGVFASTPSLCEPFVCDSSTSAISSACDTVGRLQIQRHVARGRFARPVPSAQPCHQVAHGVTFGRKTRGQFLKLPHISQCWSGPTSHTGHRATFRALRSILLAEPVSSVASRSSRSCRPRRRFCACRSARMRALSFFSRSLMARLPSTEPLRFFCNRSSQSSRAAPRTRKL